MPANYTGLASGHASREAVIISDPADGDSFNAALLNTPTNKLADYLAWIEATAGFLDATGTWTAIQTLSNLLKANGAGADDNSECLRSERAPTTRQLWAKLGGTAGSTQLVRIYYSPTYGLELTLNAFWDPSTSKWKQDATPGGGNPSTRASLLKGGHLDTYPDISSFGITDAVFAANNDYLLGGAAVRPTLGNSWVDFGSTFHVIGYYQSPDSLVHLQGSMKSGTMATVAFTLPVGFRPIDGNDMVFPVDSNGAYGMVRINANGDVVPTTGVNTRFSLDGVVFRTI